MTRTLALLAVAVVLWEGVIELTASAQTATVVNRTPPADILKNDQAFQAFLATLPTVVVEGQVPKKYFVMEGDMLLDEEQVRGSLRDTAKAMADPVAAPKYPGELKVMFRDGKPVIWDKKDRTLTYAVAKSSFPSQAQYAAVVQNMQAATDAWVKACPNCGVSFIYQSGQDASPDIKQLTFVVAYKANETQFIAAAFFPYEEDARRYLLIAPSYFQMQFDSVGVLRHELGHVLGYRHEHIGGVPGCGTEDSNWKAVTPYDGRSVMHYYCGGGGTFKMELTDKDKAGHVDTYK